MVMPLLQITATICGHTFPGIMNSLCDDVTGVWSVMMIDVTGVEASPLYRHDAKGFKFKILPAVWGSAEENT